MLFRFILGVLMVLAGTAFFIDWRLKEPQIEAIRRRIGAWLDRVRDADFNELLTRSHHYSLEFFDAFYGKSHLSRRCFFRSIVSSLFAISVCFLLYAATIQDSFLAGYRTALVGAARNGAIWIAAMVLGNLFADYFSLIETRILLRLARRSVGGLLTLLALDVLLSYAIYEIVATPLYGVLISWFSGHSVTMPEIFFHEYWASDWKAPFKGYVTAPFVLSTFFTSFIFYLFVASFFLIRLAERLRSPAVVVLKRLAGSRNPALTLVGLLGAIVAILEGIYYIISVFTD